MNKSTHLTDEDVDVDPIAWSEIFSIIDMEVNLSLITHGQKDSVK